MTMTSALLRQLLHPPLPPFFLLYGYTMYQD